MRTMLKSRSHSASADLYGNHPLGGSLEVSKPKFARTNACANLDEPAKRVSCKVLQEGCRDVIPTHGRLTQSPDLTAGAGTRLRVVAPVGYARKPSKLYNRLRINLLGLYAPKADRRRANDARYKHHFFLI